MNRLRSDTAFLIILVVLLLAALILTSMDVPGRAALAMPEPRPMPTATSTAAPGWWGDVGMEEPSLPALPGLPKVGFDRGGSGGGAGGPVAFTPISCPGPQARIASITRSGNWWLVDGTATTEPFSYWKMELSPDGSGWSVLYRSESPVTTGRLMEFNTSTVSPGSYRLRLVVVKQDGNYPAPCEIQVTV